MPFNDLESVREFLSRLSQRIPPIPNRRHYLTLPPDETYLGLEVHLALNPDCCSLPVRMDETDLKKDPGVLIEEIAQLMQR